MVQNQITRSWEVLGLPFLHTSHLQLRSTWGQVEKVQRRPEPMCTQSELKGTVKRLGWGGGGGKGENFVFFKKNCGGTFLDFFFSPK